MMRVVIPDDACDSMEVLVCNINTTWCIVQTYLHTVHTDRQTVHIDRTEYYPGILLYPGILMACTYMHGTRSEKVTE